jgi:hypothetical protein
VHPSSKMVAQSPQDSAPQRTRRRKPASVAEQERRRAWGIEWGAILSEHAKTYKRKG